MNFKIFKIKGKPEVLVYRHINDDCSPTVNFLAFVSDKAEEGQFYHETTVTFLNEEMAQAYIKDLSETTVIEFLNSFSL